MLCDLHIHSVNSSGSQTVEGVEKLLFQQSTLKTSPLLKVWWKRLSL